MGWDWVGHLVVLMASMSVGILLVRRSGRRAVARFEEGRQARLRVAARRAGAGRVARGGGWRNGWLVAGEEGSLRFRPWPWRRGGAFVITQVVGVSRRRSTSFDSWARGVEGIAELDLGPDGVVEIALGNWTSEQSLRRVLRARGLVPYVADQHR
ncbi:hypothetical protein [Nocardioides alkalitolerans]|uniref:hypothetical protein n=1 Tax=Nocardioides alkalitolerans TaxID=281714 RepID=UPI0005BB1BD7|nr:hypothetical protein [Nocardioides alkalitolerans]